MSNPYEASQTPKPQEFTAQATKDDLYHLQLLTYGFYGFAALSLMGFFFPIIHLVIGIGMLNDSNFFAPPGGWPPGPGGAPNAPPAFFGWFFVGFALIAMIFSLIFSLLSFFTGRNLAKHRNHTFCLVFAFFICLSMPLGTILGAFTIIVLLRDGVRNLFNSNIQ